MKLVTNIELRTFGGTMELAEFANQMSDTLIGCREGSEQELKQHIVGGHRPILLHHKCLSCPRLEVG